VPRQRGPPHERWLDTAKLGWYFAKSVSDEFPTLEVALAAAALWLGYRSLALARARSRASSRLEALARAIEHGDTALLGSMAHEASASWLRPLIPHRAGGRRRRTSSPEASRSAGGACRTRPASAARRGGARPRGCAA
jgi:hypothetical protein